MSAKMGHKGIYIHIPFCVRKCNYCAFLSAPADADTRETYVKALIREIELRDEQNDVNTCRDDRHRMCGRNGISGIYDTVYFGGGTPSVLSTEQIARILAKLRSAFNISPDAEITLEANPGTLGESNEEALETLIKYREMGINRLSMGVQSMNDDRLKFLGRIHDSETVKRDLRLARKAGFENVNLDIIFSVPGETSEEALADIRKIAEQEPEHISFYSLQLEEGTPLFEQWERREIEEVPDDIDRETYHSGCELLRELGYEHYEISNFAKKDLNMERSCRRSFRSRHNSGYWDMSEYVGLGLGASGFEQGVRYRNLSDLAGYEEAVSDGKLPREEEHVNTEHDNISEAVFLGLRRSEGIRYADIPIENMRDDTAEPGGDACELQNACDARAFWEYYSDVRDEAESFVKSGHMIINDEGLRLTEAGIDISNRIMALFV